VVNYKGTLIDGKEFDNSYTRGERWDNQLDFAAFFDVFQAFSPAWDHTVKTEGKRFTPDLAYGKTGVPGIPANSTLVFDVELLDIKPAPKAE
jgi:FKBP-type peptidyl-prolyl cis-trans isomerase FkpA